MSTYNVVFNNLEELRELQLQFPAIRIATFETAPRTVEDVLAWFARLDCNVELPELASWKFCYEDRFVAFCDERAIPCTLV